MSPIAIAPILFTIEWRCPGFFHSSGWKINSTAALRLFSKQSSVFCQYNWMPTRVYCEDATDRLIGIIVYHDGIEYLHINYLTFFIWVPLSINQIYCNRKEWCWHINHLCKVSLMKLHVTSRSRNSNYTLVDLQIMVWNNVVKHVKLGYIFTQKLLLPW